MIDRSIDEGAAEKKLLNIDIAIPVYNEKDNIEKNLDSLCENIAELNAHFRINIIYDFDEDNTLPVLERIKGNCPIDIILTKNHAGGVSNAIKAGFSSSTADYVIISMADISDDYSIIGKMLEQAEKGFDIICASRYMPGGKLNGGPFLKQLLSRMAGLSLNFLTGVPTRDISNSFKMYKKALLDSLVIESSGGFEIAVEITAKAFIAGKKITEIPAQWWDRTGGESKFRLLKWLPKYLKWYIYLVKNTFGKL